MDADRGPGPLPLLAGAYAAGVWAAAHLPDPGSTPLLFGIFPLAGLGLLFSRRGWRLPARLALPCAFLLAGVHGGLRLGPGPGETPCADALAAAGLPVPGERAPALLRLEGEVVAAPRFTPWGGSARLAVHRAGPPREKPVAHLPPPQPTPGLAVQLYLPQGLRPLAGDRVIAEATLDEVAVDGLDGKGRREALFREGVACVARIHEERMAVVEPASGPLATIEGRRRELLQAMRAHLPEEPASALVTALALGDREAIAPAQAERFADSGLAHLLSVSGLHLGLTVLGLFRLLAWLIGRSALAARADPLRVAAGLALPLAPLYALLTGASTPVLRAAVAAGLFLLANLAGRAPDAWSALGLALLALLAFEPALLFSASLQLSFAACWGLLALSRPLRGLVPLQRPQPDAGRPRRLLEALVASLVTTAAATLATLPFTALHFERTSVASLAANLVAVPVGLVTTALAACATGAGLIHRGLLQAPLALALPPARLLDGLAAFFASLPGARIPLPAGDPLLLPALFLIPGAVWLVGRWRRTGAVVLLVAMILLVAARWPPAPDGRLHVEFLPVGQGDCTLIRLPDGSAVLVDAGGDFRGERDVGARRVVPQLLRRGVDRLAAVAVSHLHPDHVGGMPAVLEALEVDEVWTTGRPLEESRWGRPLAEAMEAQGVPRRLLAAGDSLERAGVRIEVLGPPRSGGERDDPLLGENDASLVLRLVHGEVAVLLPGDVEEIGEWALLGGEAPLQATLLKAPHHGSRTSSTPAFLEAVLPQHVVFCVGHRNTFGFPHADVVERYRARRCELHRTDRGPVHFVSDGRTLQLAR